MSKKPSQASRKALAVPGYEYVQSAAGIEEYRLKTNNLRVLYMHRPETGVVTTNITYLVGAINEAAGETGLAHMLEHMLFKPTTFDKKNKLPDGAAMHFERATGCILNANTWKDRTTYYFSYPRKYMDEALRIEAERMTGVILNEKELTPEQGNVLSEFDMYNGNPHFALAVQMVSTAFHSHPYGHETIGYREDIEDYTPEKLESFYRKHYRPGNAVMMVIGDVERKEALEAVKKQFDSIKNPPDIADTAIAREPKQEGVRRVSINRPSTTNLVSLGFKHAGFGTKDWLTTHTMLEVLTSGPESVLHKAFVDTGKVANISTNLEPSRETNLAMIDLTLAPESSHKNIESEVLEAIATLDTKVIKSLVEKVRARMITDELFGRSNSMQIAQELTEYVASGDWTTYAKTIDQIKTVTEKDVLEHIKHCFKPANMTIGYFIGK